MASPLGCLSFAEASSSLAELAAPQATTTMSPSYRPVSPSCSATTRVTAVPAGLVSSFTTRAFLISVTLSCSRAGRTPITSASDLACSGHGKPSQSAQRTQML